MTTKIILHVSVVFLFITVCSRYYHPLFLLYAAIAVVFWLKWKQKYPFLFRWPYYLCIGATAVFAVIFNQYSANIDTMQKAPFSAEKQVLAAGTVTEAIQKETSLSLTLAASCCQDRHQTINTGTILVYLDPGVPIFGKKEKLYGASVKITGVTKPFSEAGNDGAFDEKKYYTSKGINGKIYAESIELLKPCRNPYIAATAAFRQCLHKQYEEFLSARDAGVIESMLLGERAEADTEIRELYRTGGISHLLAISGLHISLIGMLFYRLLLTFRCPKKIAALAAILFVASYIVMTGMSVSACRAGGMFTVMMLSFVWDRKYEGRTALALSAAVQLAIQPELSANLSFLYSYMAAMAILFLAQPLSQRIQAGKISGSLILSGSIQLVLLPLFVYSNYELVLISLLLNIVVLPLATPLLLLALIGGIASAAVHSAQAFLPFPMWNMAETVFRLLFMPVQYILQFYEMLCEWAGRLPFASILTGKPKLWQVLAAYLLLLTALVLFRKVLFRKKKPCMPLKNRKIWNRRGAYVLAGIAFFILLYRPASGFKLVMLDVGQGDGIFFQTDRMHACFIDGGSSSQRMVGKYQILPFLKSNRIRKIDYWFVSHSDTDHISGLIEVLDSGYPVRFLVYAKAQEKDGKLEMAAKKAGTKILYVTAGQQLKWEDTFVSVLAPSAEESSADKNEASLVLYIKNAGFTGLFGGDISTKQEEELAQKYDFENITCFKADHHGSKNSNGELLLEELKPQITIISAGENNRYGHPHAEALERIYAASQTVYMTAEHGQITIVNRKNEYIVQ